MSKLIFILGVLVSAASLSNAFAVYIDAHDEECFLETVSTGTRMSLTFQVAEGGFLDIDVSVSHRLLLLYADYWS